MLSQVARLVSKPVGARAYGTLRMPMRSKVAKGPTRALDHKTGSGTASFNEREQALENKHVKDHEAAALKKLRDDEKNKSAAPATAKTARSAGLRKEGSAEVESLQKQIDALQKQLNQLKK